VRRVAAIIVAAGSGTRFGSQKQLVMLGGKPLFLHSLLIFAAHPQVTDIVVAVPEDLRQEIHDLTAAIAPPPILIVTGGITRQRSVENTLQALEYEADDIVLIHDAARPFVEPTMIHDLLHKLLTWDAAITAIPVTDTLKRLDDVTITETVPRKHLFRAQTPQAVKFGVLRDAIHAVGKTRDDFTDEAEMLEAFGIQCTIVQGSEDNVKITFPEDLRRAEAILQIRNS
jgi:2-C-methyl-D-erythritol 4-phosphate cytidylyltransferase / 2-C-methyl-D-erythritol 2,4-cyclodiphosphate synthase